MKIIMSDEEKKDSWDLPSGTYTVFFDKAPKGSKDYSSRIWVQKGIGGRITIVFEEIKK